jgi:hypothetical protein
MKKYILLVIVMSILAYLFLPSRDDCREIEAVIHDVTESGKKKDLDSVIKHFSIEYRNEYRATYPVVKNVIKDPSAGLIALTANTLV